MLCVHLTYISFAYSAAYLLLYNVVSIVKMYLQKEAFQTTNFEDLQFSHFHYICNFVIKYSY